MDPTQAAALRDILQTQQLAALGTLHQGEPFVSMVPYASLPDGSGFVIHVSQLAGHTKDMQLHSGVSLMVVALHSSGVSAQATARVTIQGQARPCPESDDRHAQAKAAYLARFPQSADMFDFADFSLFLIQPSAVRFVGGFAQARSVSPATLAEILGNG